MLDRLMLLLLTLTVAVPAATRGPCCCAAPSQPGAETCEIGVGERSAPACCQASEAESSCCGDTCGDAQDPFAPCGCQHCLAHRPLRPMAPSRTAEVEATQDTWTYLLPAAPAVDRRLAPPDHVRRLSLLDREPPDRLALLCVWIL